MSEPTEFSVNLTNPAVADGPQGVATLCMAADGGTPVANELRVQLSADDSTSPLSGTSVATVRIDLSGLLGMAQITGIGVSEGSWSARPVAGQAAVAVTSAAPITAPQQSFTLTGLIVTKVIPGQPVITLNEEPSFNQNDVRVLQRPQHQPLAPSLSAGQRLVVPIGPDGISPSLDVKLQCEGADGTGGTVTLWFNACDDTVPPSRNDLGRRSEVVDRFTIDVPPHGTYGNDWTPIQDEVDTPPSWSFALASTKTFLPQAQAEFRLTGALSAGTPAFPNLEGDANLWVQIDGVSGYDRALTYIGVTKVVPIRDLKVGATDAAGARPVYPQDPGAFLVDLTGATSDVVDLSLTLGVDADVITWISAYVPGGDVGEFGLYPIDIKALSLANPADYMIAAGADRGVELGQRAVTFRGVQLVPGAQLPGAKLRDADLRNATLSNAVLTGADLTGADLRGAHLDGAHLEQAILAGAKLGGAILTGAHLDHADLSGADVEGTQFDSATLDWANLDAVTSLDSAVKLAPKWVTVSKLATNGPGGLGDLTGLDLSRAYLAGAPLAGANLRGANLSESILTDAALELVDLAGITGLETATGVANKWITVWKLATHGASQTPLTAPFDFCEAYLGGAPLAGIKVPKADFTGANLSGADLTGNADLTGADFSRCDLSASKLTGAGLTGATLDYAKLGGTTGLDPSTGVAGKWITVNALMTAGASHVPIPDPTKLDVSRAYLGSADLAGMKATGATFTSADLTGANLTGADLSGAHLDSSMLSWSRLGATLTGTVLTDAVVDFVDWRGALEVDRAIGLAPKWSTVWQVVNEPPRDSSLGTPNWGVYVLPPDVPDRAPLVGCDLSRANLAGAALYSRDLSRANLRGASLTGADFGGSVLSGADLTGADLAGADFSHVKLAETEGMPMAIHAGRWQTVWTVQKVGPAQAGALNGADLSYADLRGLDFQNVSLSGTALTGADLRGANLTGCDLSGAALRWATLTGLDMSVVRSFADVTVDFTSWLGVLHLDRAPGVDPRWVTKWRLANEGPTAPGLPGTLEQINPASANFNDVDWSQQQLAGQSCMGNTFVRANFRGINFSNQGGLGFSVLTDACFEQANFKNGILTLSWLRGADFRGADLTGAQVVKVDVTGADLSTATLTSVKWHDVNYDATTKWPPGYIPPPPGDGPPPYLDDMKARSAAFRG